jgi:hypothetical protein
MRPENGFRRRGFVKKCRVERYTKALMKVKLTLISVLVPLLRFFVR